MDTKKLLSSLYGRKSNEELLKALEDTVLLETEGKMSLGGQMNFSVIRDVILERLNKKATRELDT